MEHLIEVKNLHTEFRQSKGILKAVNGVSYYLDPGEIVAFVGESGSGKSVTQYSGVQLIASPPGRITEGEIIDAIRRPLGARSLDGVKRRTRAGMGRCQAGFCSPRVMEILAREWDMDIRDVTKSGGASRILAGTNTDIL